MEKVAREVAEAEIDRFLEMMDLEQNLESLSAEGRDEFNRTRERLVNAVCNGRLVVNENGEPVLTVELKRADGEVETRDLRFREPTGATYMQADKKKEGENMAKMFAMFAEMTRTDIKTFSRLRGSDVRICTALGGLFLA